MIWKRREPMRRFSAQVPGTEQVSAALSHHADGLYRTSLEFGRVTSYNLPPAVAAHPNIRESAFVAEWLAVFVLAYVMIVSRRNCKVLAIHPHVEGRVGRTGVCVGVILIQSKEGFLGVHGAVRNDVGKVVRQDSLKMAGIFCERGLAPWNGKLR